MVGFLLRLFIVISLITLNVPYASKDVLFEATQKYHQYLGAKKKYHTAPDIFIDPAHTPEKRLDHLLENYESIIQEIDTAAIQNQWPELRYLGHLYLNLPTKCFFRYDEDELVDNGFKNRKNIQKVADIFKEKLLKNVKYYRHQRTLRETLVPQQKSQPSYAELHQTSELLHISHGGNLFYILRFLSGIEPGYRLESNDRLGIQITPLDTENQLLYKCYNYAVMHRSLIDYSAVFFADIDPQYLDAAPRGYEAGLPTANRSELRNIRIEVIKKHSLPTVGFYNFEIALDDEHFIRSKTQEFISCLESLGELSEYRSALISAFKNLTFIAMSESQE